MTDLVQIGIEADTSQVKKGKKDLEDLGRAGEKVVDTLGNKLSKAIKLAAGSFALFKTYQLIKDMALLNARFETLGIVMTVVGRNAGYTSKQMNGFAEDVRKMGITMIESRNTVIRMAQAQLDLSKASSLARVAQDAAVIGGVNSSQALERMVLGIQRGETEILRTIGLNVQWQKGYDELAKQMNTTTANLTEQQKTQSRLDTVLKESIKIQGSYEAAMGSAGKQVTSVERYIEDLKVILGETFNDALTILVFGFSDALKEANEEARNLAQKDELKKWGEATLDVIAAVADSINELIGGLRLAMNDISLISALAQNLTTPGGRHLVKDIIAQYEEDQNKILASSDRFEKALAARRKLKEDDKNKLDPVIEQGMADAAANNLLLGREEAATESKEVEKAREAYAKLIETVKDKISASRQELALIRQGVPEKDAELITQMRMKGVSDELVVATLNSNAAREQAIKQLEAEQDLKELRLESEKEWAEQVEQTILLQAEEYNTQYESIQALQDKVDAQIIENELIGKTVEQVRELNDARFQEQIGILETEQAYLASQPGREAELALLERKIELMKELYSAQEQSKELKKAEEEHKQFWNSIERTAHTVWNQVWLDGNNAFKNIGKTIKSAILDMLYQITVKKWIIGISASVTGSSAGGGGVLSGLASVFGSDGQVAGGGGVLSTINNVAKLFTNGTSGVTSAIEGLGALLANGNGGILDTVGGFLGANAGTISGYLPYAGAVIQALQGDLKGAAFTAAGAAIGSIIPGVGTAIGAVIGSFVGSFFGGGTPKRNWAQTTGVTTDGQFNATTNVVKRDGVQAISALNNLQASFSGTLSALLQAFGSKADFSTYAAFSTRPGKSTKAGMGFNINGQSYGTGEFRYGKKDSGAWDKFVEQALGSMLVKAIQYSDLSDGVKKFFDGVTSRAEVEATVTTLVKFSSALQDLPPIFDNIKNMITSTSISMKASDLETTFTKMQEYTNLFYTDAEKLATYKKQLSTQMAYLGLGLPGSREGFRSLVDGITVIDDITSLQLRALLELAPAADAYYNALKEQEDQLNSTANSLRDLNSFTSVAEYRNYKGVSKNYSAEFALDNMANNRSGALSNTSSGQAIETGTGNTNIAQLLIQVRDAIENNSGYLQTFERKGIPSRST